MVLLASVTATLPLLAVETNVPGTTGLPVLVMDVEVNVVIGVVIDIVLFTTRLQAQEL